MRASTSCAFLSRTRPRRVTSLWPAGSGTYWSLKSPSDGRQQSKPCVRSPPPTAFASFTGLADYVGNSNADLSRNLAENVDLPAIFRTLDQGVCPGLILAADDGSMMICSGYTMIIGNDTIAITFAPIRQFNLSVSVSLTKTDSGGTAIRIPGSEWYLEASTQSLA